MNIAIAFVIATFGVSPIEDVVVEQVDLIEVSHVYDEKGKPVRDQVTFYDWSPDHSRYMVRDWRPLKNQTQMPIRDWHHGGHVSIWHDGEVLRRVHAWSVWETWTQYDPELTERTWLPKEMRRELTPPPAVPKKRPAK